MKNQLIRQTASKNGVYLWEIAERVGLADCNFSRKLRRELPLDEQEQIVRLIYEIAEEREEAEHERH